jgi:hypothetical protein
MSVEDYISTSLSDTYSNIKHKATFIAWVTAGWVTAPDVWWTVNATVLVQQPGT